MSKNLVRVGISAAALMWTEVAFAACGLPWTAPCTTSVPEMDGGAAVMALALVASVAGLIYNRTRK